MIKAYVGLLGRGKTLNMTYDLIEIMKTGRRVISNTPINFEYKKQKFQAEFIQDGALFQHKILHESNAVFAIDEASIFFPSQFWNKLTGAYIMKFAQSRKYGCDFYYTSQGFAHTIKRIRDLTNIVVKCTSTRIPLLGIPLYHATEYDPEYFAQRIISSPAVEQRYILSKRTLYPSQYKIVYKAYNTLHLVNSSALTGEKDGEVENFDL